MIKTKKHKPVKIENRHYEYRGYTVQKVHHSGSGYWVYIYLNGERIYYTSPSLDYRPSLRKDGFQEIDYMLKLRGC